MKNWFKYLATWVILLNLMSSVSAAIIQVPAENSTEPQQVDRLKKIKEKGVLTVLSANDEPYSYKDPRTGELIGVDVDIIREVAKRLGINKINVIYTTFGNSLEELTRNPNIDLFVELIYATDERKKLVNFTNPIYTLNEVILTRKDSGINGKGDLKDKVIGVLDGTVYKSVVDGWKNQGILKDFIVFYDNNSLTIALENKTVDAILADSVTAENIILSKPKLNFRVVSPSKYKSEIAFSAGYPLKKEDTALLNAINEKLEDMKNDGTLYEILGRYGLAGHYIP